jgi:hypothetical protein
MKKPKEYFIRPGDGFKQRDLILLQRAEPDDIHVITFSTAKEIVQAITKLKVQMDDDIYVDTDKYREVIDKINKALADLTD